MQLIKIEGHLINIDVVTRIEIVSENNSSVAILFFPDGKHYRILRADLDEILRMAGIGEIKEYPSAE